ncbi:hypothetical protein ACFWBF_31845 [Streptomyces sp. NPDC060028]|uniref:hypothetical protein n=1 Tax=Streptomyces sp. NPDC060028 TaxID=3347041 RepID=UPI0036BA7DAE
MARTAAAIAGGAVTLAAVVVAGFWASAKLDEADRTSPAPTRYWLAEGIRPTPAASGPSTLPTNELTSKLLPMPKGFGLGPDLGSQGNDFYVPGERAVQAFKDSSIGLPDGERTERDRAVDALKVGGLAGRSYNKEATGTVAEVLLLQAAPQGVAKFSEVGRRLLEVTGNEREGPRIDGFPQAKCSLHAVGEEGKKEEIGSINCVAVEGGILVSFRMYGPRPFSTSDAADLFTQQLKHLKSLGESL